MSAPHLFLKPQSKKDISFFLLHDLHLLADPLVCTLFALLIGTKGM